MRWIGLGALILSGSVHLVLSADLISIDSIRLNEEGDVRIQLESNEGEYYILTRATELSDFWEGVSLKPGDGERIEFVDPARGERRDTSYYQVISFGSETPLDFDEDGMDDLYEFERFPALSPFNSLDAFLDSDGDGLANGQEVSNGLDPLVADTPTIFSSSPVNGETGVAVTRETRLSFDRPLSQELDSNFPGESIQAFLGESRLNARYELSTDRKEVAVFFPDHLPGNALVRFIVDGDMIHDENGVMVDADRDLIPGGVGILEFTTLNNLPNAGTGMMGRVFASELAPGANDPGQSVNVPLEGVVITVDGQEDTLSAVTDAEGNFHLFPAPSGRFFAHIDGRNAVGSVWPDGSYYPMVGKAFVTRPGVADNLAGATGEIFLPLVAEGSLTSVSSDESTEITFPESALEEYPALVGSSIEVAPDSLFANDGTRGGQVGIAPVPADRLPGPLPEEMNFPLVITVQTDGPTNFDTPAKVRFPNLPDPETGERLPPGAKSGLWSFNHDAGYWEPVGSMTVSEDGLFIVSDPGVGILAPGWHSWDRRTRGRGPTRPGKKPCPTWDREDSITNVKELGIAAAKCAGEFLRLKDNLKALIRIGANMRSLHSNLIKIRENIKNGASKEVVHASLDSALALKSTVEQSIILVSNGPNNPVSLAKKVITCSTDVLTGLDSVCNSALFAAAGGPCPSNKWLQLACISVKSSRSVLSYAKIYAELAENGLRKGGVKAVCAGLDIVSQWLNAVPGGRSLSQLDSLTLSAAKLQSLDGGEPISAELVDLLEDVFELLPDLDEDIRAYQFYEDGFFTMADQLVQVTDDLARAFAEQGSYPGIKYYLLEIAGSEIRGMTDEEGSLSQILEPEADYILSMFDPMTGHIGLTGGITGSSGETFEFRMPFFIEEENGVDTDADGLSDLAEHIVGTLIDDPDTDADGFPDGMEISQGQDPLDGSLLVTGIIASAQTPGRALDIDISGNMAAVANGELGVSLYNIFSGMSPRQVGWIDTEGEATRVDLEGSRLVVSDGLNGLLVYDVDQPTDPQLLHHPFTDIVVSADISGDFIYAVTHDQDHWWVKLVILDLQTGQVIAEQPLSTSFPQDVLVDGHTVWVLTFVNLESYQFDARTHSIESLGVVGLESVFIGDIGGYAMYKDGDHLLVTHNGGVNVVNIEDPAAPELIQNWSTGWLGWKRIALNGSGWLIAAADETIDLQDTDQNIQLFQYDDPTSELTFVREFETPGAAMDVELHEGLVYVADGTGGIHLLNYLPLELEGTAPTVELGVVGGITEVEQAQTIKMEALVAEDVQTRRVRLVINGSLELVDTDYPFVFELDSEQFSIGEEIQVTAIAEDTAGREGISEILKLSVIADATPPMFEASVPKNGESLQEDRKVTLFFSEPLNPDIPFGDLVQFRFAGDNFQIEEQDMALSAESVDYDSNTQSVTATLPENAGPGLYEVFFDGGYSDMNGVIATETVSSEFWYQHGLNAEYYNGIDLEDLRLNRQESQIDYDLGSGRPFMELGYDNFSVRWTGWVTADFGETYSIETINDDGVRVWIDDELIIDDWLVHGAIENSGQVEFEAGVPRQIRIEYFEQEGGSVMQLKWASARTFRQIIPARNLTPTQP